MHNNYFIDRRLSASLHTPFVHRWALQPLLFVHAFVTSYTATCRTYMPTARILRSSFVRRNTWWCVARTRTVNIFSRKISYRYVALHQLHLYRLLSVYHPCNVQTQYTVNEFRACFAFIAFNSIGKFMVCKFTWNAWSKSEKHMFQRKRMESLNVYTK